MVCVDIRSLRRLTSFFPDIVHYNTVILGFCREGRALDACKVLEDMPSNGCLPNLVSYRALVGGLSDHGKYDEAKTYIG